MTATSTSMTTTSKLPRKGRPPLVERIDDVYHVRVKGITYSFRNLRAVGTNRSRTGPDMEYARVMVARTMEAEAAA